MSAVSLRDRFNGNNRLLMAAVAPAAWLGLSALFGGIHVMDWLVAAFLLVSFALSSRRKKPSSDSSHRGIYGPPE
jgi:hypothetical protein